MGAVGHRTIETDVTNLLETVEDEDDDLKETDGEHEERRRQARVLILEQENFTKCYLRT